MTRRCRVPWGFMDWVRGRPVRPDQEALTLPENASPAALRAMALRLLEDKHAYKAYELLREQPDAARPVLEDLVRNDARFRSMTDVRKSWMQPIYEVALTILSEWDSPY